MLVSCCRIGLLLACMAFAAPAAKSADAPHRILSANLCTDQLVLALADSSQIASLSPFARDPAMSYLAALAGQFPQNRGSGEDMVRLDADLVLIGPYDSGYTRALLIAQHLRFESAGPWTTLADGNDQIRHLAELFGHQERGEALVAQIEAARASLKGLARREGRAPKVLVLQRRGYVFHSGVVGELLAQAGLENAAADLFADAGFVSLEAILRAAPDYLIVSDADQRAEDQGQAFLQHPALARLYPPEKRLVLPDRLTLCGGPSTLDLIRALAEEIRRKVG
ncbi:MAG: Fe3+-hydroxamate transporter substrate-binding protein [Hyphomicrobiales bacterium]|nr:Fe3+-hydroxamate transporter substrate-binding protein [Hyphomicrobiales bacterium]